MSNEMSKGEAIDYLDRKGKDSSDIELVEKVMKKGEIYGDPIAELD